LKGKVLFVVHDVYQSDNEIPLGISYLVAALKQEGVYAKVWCADVYHYANAEIAQRLAFSEWDIIGVGFLAARFVETVLPLCETINKYKKNAWLVLGGHGPSALPKYMLEKTKADVICIGEADETIVDVVKCKVNNKRLSTVNGIAYKDKRGQIHVNPQRDPPKNLDSLPFPAWEEFPMDIYTSNMQYAGQDRREKSFQLISSRGCCQHPRCSFCFEMHKGYRLRSVENVVEEMKILYKKYSVSYFEFQDEMYVLGKKRLLEFRDAWDKAGLKVKFYCQTRVDNFDRETAEILKEMGCKKINIGFESMDDDVLKAMGKNTTADQNESVAQICKEVGLNMGLNFIWGLPKDTEESLRKDVDFILKYNTYGEMRTVRPPSPYPSCRLYEDAIKQGLLSGPQDFFDKFQNSDLLTVNFTNISEDKFYKLLFEANKTLLRDHYAHTNDVRALEAINSFHRLYFEGETKYRGARHFEKKVTQHTVKFI